MHMGFASNLCLSLNLVMLLGESYVFVEAKLSDSSSPACTSHRASGDLPHPKIVDNDHSDLTYSSNASVIFLNSHCN